MTTAKYPPYINAYNSISKLFEKIKSASVPPKFTYDFLKTILGFSSSSMQAAIPLLKKLGFLDQASVPTQAYKDYRIEGKSRVVMAERVRDAYKDIYQTHEYAHKVEAKELRDNLIAILGVEKKDPHVPSVVSTFMELVKLADFEKASEVPPREHGEPGEEEKPRHPRPHVVDNFGSENLKFGISYTINLNLPPTTDIQVFDAIFKSLKGNILDNDK